MRRVAVLIALIAVLAPASASEAEDGSARPLAMEEVCAVLQAAAAAHELPLPFFARLIWQESHFRSDAVSPAGARGIAQFMPATAFERGLYDPHDPIDALRHSAGFLQELRAQFGNLGLAAAAYNSGPERVLAWLESRRELPSETRHYVWIVTGVPVDAWKEADKVVVQTNRLPDRIPCPELLAAAGQPPSPERVRLASAGMLRSARPPSTTWSVVVAGSFSHDHAQQQSERLQQRLSAVLDGRMPVLVRRRVPGRGSAPMIQVRIEENDRASAQRLCARLRAGGTGCVVMRAS